MGAISLPGFRADGVGAARNIGSWMQTVGAKELTLTTSATLVASIQTAADLPVVLLSVPAVAIDDLVTVAAC